MRLVIQIRTGDTIKEGNEYFWGDRRTSSSFCYFLIVTGSVFYIQLKLQIIDDDPKAQLP